MSDPTQNTDDEFSAAFAELQKPAASSTPAAAAAPAAPAEAAVSPSTPAPAGTDAPAAAAAAPSGEKENDSAASGAATPAASAEASSTTAAQPAATPESEAPAPTPAPAAQPDYATQIAALTAQLEELKKAPAAEAPAPTPAPAQPVYTDDEKKIVEDYLKEWPDTARGEALLRRAEYQQLVGFMFEQLRPRLEALEAGYQTSSTRTQYQDIVALVPDYDDVRDKTLAWIDTQPAYLKAAYQQVANEGSAKDVADLITRFKKETNYVAAGGTGGTPAPAAPAAASAPAAGTGAAPAPAAPSGGLAPAAAAAAASLRVVKTSRSEPVSAPDPNDFEAAFKEFASAN